jgi:hypothetical protein
MGKARAGFGIIEIIIGLALLGMIGAGGWFIWNKYQSTNVTVDSYETCAAAGNPILETYPEQCVANGKTYTNPTQKPLTR